MAFLPVLGGCEPSSIGSGVAQEELDHFVAGVKRDLIFMEGGTFTMGDFGIEHGAAHEPFDWKLHTRPLHEVKLSGFSISKFKVTNREYQFFLRAQGRSLRQDVANQQKFDAISAPPDHPAHLDWYEADRYCSWLASSADLDFSLPSEAQWEYAARSEGRYIAFSTDDGLRRVSDTPISLDWKSGPEGINISTLWDRLAHAAEMDWRPDNYLPLPVDRFPPNASGVYSMTDNGMEWVSDWYDPHYYENSPEKDPKGPNKPIFKSVATYNQYAKVLRGAVNIDTVPVDGYTIFRAYENPAAAIRGPDGDLIVINDKTARCVVNNPKPLN